MVYGLGLKCHEKLKLFILHMTGVGGEKPSGGYWSRSVWFEERKESKRARKEYMGRRFSLIKYNHYVVFVCWSLHF